MNRPNRRRQPATERKITLVTPVTVSRADAEAIAVMSVLLKMFTDRDRPGWHQPAPISLERVRDHVRRSVAANGPSAAAVATRSAELLSARLPSVDGKRPTAGIPDAVKEPVGAAFTWSPGAGGEPAVTLHIRRQMARAEAEAIVTARVLQWIVSARGEGRDDWYRFPWNTVGKGAIRRYVKTAYREHGDQAPARAAELVKRLAETLRDRGMAEHVAQMAAGRVNRAWDWDAPAVSPPDDSEPALQ